MSSMSIVAAECFVLVSGSHKVLAFVTFKQTSFTPDAKERRMS